MRDKIVMVALMISLMACGKAGDTGVNGLGGADGRSGLDGVDGQQGLQGVQGAAGASQGCTVTQTSVGAFIACADGSNAVVLHGQKGLDGKDCGRRHQHGKK